MISYAGPKGRLRGAPPSIHHAPARPRVLRDPTESIRFRCDWISGKFNHGGPNFKSRRARM